MQPHRGSTILVLGILGIPVCFICGIIAWVMGNKDLAAMDAGLMDPSGRDQTNAGRTCGIVGTIIGILAVLGMIAYFVFIFLIIGVASAGASSGLEGLEGLEFELQP